MGRLFTLLKRNISALAVVAAAASGVSAEESHSRITFPDGGDYTQFSNPEFVACAAEGLSNVFPDHAVNVTRNETYNGGESVFVKVPLSDRILGPRASFYAASYDNDGFMGYANLSITEGLIKVLEARPGGVNDRGNVHYTFFDDLSLEDMEGLTPEFIEAMRGISECPTSLLAVNVAKRNAGNSIASIPPTRLLTQER